MKATINSAVALLASALFLSSCGNDSSTANNDQQDSSTQDTTSQTSNATMDTMNSTGGAMSTSGTNDGLMNSMQSSMDRMKAMQMTGDFDVDFTNMMIEHHQGGIDMAQAEIAQGKDEQMKAKAQEIVTKQKEEQQKLRDFVSSYKPSGMKHGEGELQKSMQEMMTKMQGMKMSGDVDKDFAMMMSSHHEDGIKMEKMELKNGMSKELKNMTQKSIDHQQQDIKDFKKWMDNHK